MNGRRVASRESFSEDAQFYLANWAIWSDFKLVQNTADGFIIQKRINDQSAWIDAGAGNRSRGMAFAGDVSGGIALGIRDFWQAYPSSLEVGNMGSEIAKLTAWLWSPDGSAMDMRRYDTIPWGTL